MIPLRRCHSHGPGASLVPKNIAPTLAAAPSINDRTPAPVRYHLLSMTPFRLRLSLLSLTLILVNYKKIVLPLTTYLGITLPLPYLLGFGFHSRKYGYH